MSDPAQSSSPIHPSWAHNSQQEPRLVGVELELAGLGLDQLTTLVQACTGGKVERLNDYQATLTQTPLGTIRIEFDAAIFRELKVRKVLDDLTTDLVAQGDRREFEKGLARLAEQLTPFELIFEPLPFSRLPELEQVRAAIAGQAQGTRSSPLSAYGVHLNVETPSMDVDTVLTYLRAFLVLYEELKVWHQVDLTRVLYGFLDPFPKDFVVRVLDSRYRPTFREFLEDYLEANPTRNRPLDLLPILAYHDEKRVRQRLPEEKISPRPAFHYRLPNSRINEPDWTIAGEWEIWTRVERLAHNPEQLAKRMARERRRLLGPLRHWYRTVMAKLSSKRRPIIAVTGPDEGGFPAWICTWLAVRRAGGRSLRFTPGRFPEGSVLPEFDGLILGGGADVDPGRYGEELHTLIEDEEEILHKSKRERLYSLLLSPFIFFGRTLFSLSASKVDLARDAFEHRCLDLAMAEQMPILGICRGAQFLNVHLGGTLNGDLSSYYGDVSKMNSVFPKKPVQLEEGSRLARILKAQRLRVNSLHSQAVCQLGAGIVITARDDSGVVQGIEHQDYSMMVGVQWHPEYLPAQRRQQRLFRALVLQARTHSRQRLAR